MSEVKLAGVVMSAYLRPNPERSQVGRDLTAQLNALGLSTELQDRPAALAQTCRSSWQRLTRRDDLTHGIVLQDDIVLAPRFVEHVLEIARVNPDNVISFMYVRNLAKTALVQGKHWVAGHTGWWPQAIVAPIALADDFVRWEQRYILPSYMHDDGRWVIWAMAKERLLWTTAPSLVQHRMDLKTTLKHGGGINRKASTFLEDERNIDWTAGLDSPVYDKDTKVGPASQVEIDRLRRMGVMK